jgi:ectoine hydroxylase-related dioxygenase (phytanoyl-CoA dioxygenase family)
MIKTINIHKKSRTFLFFFLFCVFVLFLLYLLIKVYTTKERVDTTGGNYNLQRDGVCIIKNVLDDSEIEYLKQMCKTGNYAEAKKRLINHSGLQNKLQQVIGVPDYMLQDYIWIIQKSSVHTCHRDNNGDFFNEGQQYPSYTLLIYLENMERCLGVIPGSHLDVNSYNVNLTDDLVHFLCKPGDAILFNANLIHVGAINDSGDDHLRIQMKVSHRNDIDTLEYYQNFNKVLREENTVPRPLRLMQKNASCMFPVISNMSQKENIMSARGSDNGASIGIGQKIFSSLFYGKSDFYDLPNAF